MKYGFDAVIGLRLAAALAFAARKGSAATSLGLI
jgi:hypothetical protein